MKPDVGSSYQEGLRAQGARRVFVEALQAFVGRSEIGSMFDLFVLYSASALLLRPALLSLSQVTALLRS